MSPAPEGGEGSAAAAETGNSVGAAKTKETSPDLASPMQPSQYRRYILTQGPLHTTACHFWQMVWEQNSLAIVMLNKGCTFRLSLELAMLTFNYLATCRFDGYNQYNL